MDFFEEQRKGINSRKSNFNQEVKNTRHSYKIPSYSHHKIEKSQKKESTTIDLLKSLNPVKDIKSQVPHANAHIFNEDSQELKPNKAHPQSIKMTKTISNSRAKPYKLDKRLNAALGSIFGAFIGDSIGSVLEFKGRVTDRDINEAMLMQKNGYFGNGPGQVTDDSELAMCILNGLLDSLESQAFNPNFIALYYKQWINSEPFDIGTTTRKAFSVFSKVDNEYLAASVQDWVEVSINQSLSNGSLMRATPLAVFCRNLSDKKMKYVVRQDVSMTHSNLIIKDAVLLYVMCISKIINDPDHPWMALDYIRQYAKSQVFSEAKDWLETSLNHSVNYIDNKNIGYARIAFHHTFREFSLALRTGLFDSQTYIDTIQMILSLAGDTDTNAAIAGGLIGACVGYDNLPKEFKKMVKGKGSKGSWIKRPRFLDQREVKDKVINLFYKTESDFSIDFD